MTTGQRIREARKKAGLTQAALAEKLGISYVGVSQWENDLRNPKYETLRRIADALGVFWLDIAGDNYVDTPGTDLSLFRDAMRSGMISPVDVAYAANFPLATVWETMQDSDSLDEEAKNKIRTVGVMLWLDVMRSGSKADRETIREISFSIRKLNEEGQRKAVERVEELTEIPKYQRTAPQEPPKSPPPTPEGTDTTPDKKPPESP